MPKINVSKSHSLPQEDMEKRVEEYLVKLRDEKLKMVGFDYKWNPDRKGVALTGKGFSGDVKLSSSLVEICIDLGLMLSPFKSTVEDSLKRGLDRYLA